MMLLIPTLAAAGCGAEADEDSAGGAAPQRGAAAGLLHRRLRQGAHLPHHGVRRQGEAAGVPQEVRIHHYYKIYNSFSDPEPSTIMAIFTDPARSSPPGILHPSAIR